MPNDAQIFGFHGEIDHPARVFDGGQVPVELFQRVPGGIPSLTPSGHVLTRLFDVVVHVHVVVLVLGPLGRSIVDRRWWW
jgi:hypothetical protein